MDWNNAFAASETTRLNLDDGGKFWIDVRNELGHEEQRSIATASIKGVSRSNTGDSEDARVELDLGAGADRKVVVYLADWNLVDKQGKTIDISNEQAKRDALKNIKPEFFKAIERKIDAHVLERATKKMNAGSDKHEPI